MIRLSIQDVYRYFLYVIFFLNLSFFNILSDLTHKLQYFSLYLTFFLFVIYLLQKRASKTTRFTSVIVILFLLMIIFNLFRRGIPINGILPFSDKFFYLRNFTCILLAFPISENKSDFLRLVFALGISAIIFRSVVWFSYNYVNLNIAPGIIQERGANWTRYGAVRLQALFLDGYVLAYVLCKLLVSASKHKLSYSLFLLITLFYESVIYASRSQIIGFCAMFITIYLFKSQSSRSKVFSFFTLILTSLGIISTPYYNKFLDSFSVINSDYGAGTMVRIVGKRYYQDIWKQVQILGFGQTSDGNVFNGWKYYISDLGIIRILYQFGIIGFIICLLPILYGCYAGFKHRIHFEGMLLFSLSIFVLVTSFASQNLYDYSRIMLLPLLLGMANTVSTGQLDRVVE